MKKQEQLIKEINCIKKAIYIYRCNMSLPQTINDNTYVAVSREWYAEFEAYFRENKSKTERPNIFGIVVLSDKNLSEDSYYVTRKIVQEKFKTE